MISEAVIQALRKFVPEENICLQESMASHTTFRIGGLADCFVQLENTEQLIKVQKYLSQVGVPFFVLGNGSNLLVSDAGFRGVILQIGSKMNRVTVEGNVIVAQAGASMAQIARTAMEHELTGMEFASGIPGTIGGGVVMNAGAYGGELSQIVTQVNVVNSEGGIMELDNETMEFGYRTSALKNHPFIVTSCTLCLKPGNQEEIRAKMADFQQRRREKQPLEFPSAGSTFKRPEGHFAGKLIMDAGLSGYQIGGAQVSPKHCGFVVNTGDATAKDIKDLIDYIRETVYERFSVHLEPEVIMLGKF